jgi:C-terminal processing protease CtpA/Prc
LLTDRRSFSAASSFAATFRCYGLGIIIGEPTGGTRTFFGNSIPIRLKYSSIILNISTIKNYTTCFTEDENEAIIPDVVATTSVLDKVNKSDQTLYYTLRLIKKLSK